MNEILIYGDIGPDYYGMFSADNFMDQMEKCNASMPLTVRINSPGGDVDHAQAIYNAMRRYSDGGGKVNVAIDAVAASAASFVAMAGDTIGIAENGAMMMHNCWTAALFQGDLNDFDKFGRTVRNSLEAFGKVLVRTYAARAGKQEPEMQQMLDAETWLVGKDAVDQGFATEICQPLKMAAKSIVPKNRFRKTPREFMAGDAMVVAASMARLAIPRSVVPDNPPGGDGKGIEGEWSKPSLEDFTDKGWGELDDVERSRIAKFYTWYGELDDFGDLKLPHHFAKSGKPSLDAVRDALARLDQTEGMSAEDKAKAKAHLERHMPTETENALREHRTYLQSIRERLGPRGS